MSFLDKIHFVLVGITHPGNIGAAARALKTMGLSHMSLVQPKLFPCAEATARASGADDLLANASIHSDFADSLQEYRLIFGASARQRSIRWQSLTPRACAEKALDMNGKVAIVFGREQSGLTNEELDLCHYLVQIPTNPEFASLNVSAAVQIFAYELRCMALEKGLLPLENIPEQLTSPSAVYSIQSTEDSLASSEEMTLFYKHLEQTLIEIGFLDPDKPRRLMRRLHRLFNRIQPSESEINILRGILTAAQQHKPKRD